jgi:hypothetical protein
VKFPIRATISTLTFATLLQRRRACKPRDLARRSVEQAPRQPSKPHAAPSIRGRRGFATPTSYAAAAPTRSACWLAEGDISTLRAERHFYLAPTIISMCYQLVVWRRWEALHIPERTQPRRRPRHPRARWPRRDRSGRTRRWRPGPPAEHRPPTPPLIAAGTQRRGVRPTLPFARPSGRRQLCPAPAPCPVGQRKT